jgi:hypothetical protein
MKTALFKKVSPLEHLKDYKQCFSQPHDLFDRRLLAPLLVNIELLKKITSSKIFCKTN